MNRLTANFSRTELDRLRILLELSLEDGLIFPNWEFSILTGAQVEEARTVLSHWPNVDLKEESVWLTLSGVLRNIVGYPHRQEKLIFQKTSLQTHDLKELLDRLNNARKCGWLTPI